MGTSTSPRVGDDLIRELTAAVATGQGARGIASVLHRVTGGTVVIDDGEGARLAHAGDDAVPQGALSDCMPLRPEDHARAIRVGNWVLTAVRPGAETLGVIGLHDPAARAGAPDLAALEQGSLVLATELFRLRSVASNEVRVWGDLAAELLDSPDIDRTRSHTAALGYPLDRPHRALVIVATGSDRLPSTAAVRQAFRSADIDGRLMTHREHDVVTLVAETVDPAVLATTLHGSGSQPLRLGIGNAHDPAELGKSVGEADLALRMSDADVVRFDDLGIAQFLSTDADTTRLRTFVDEWLGALEAYDRAHHAEFVHTLDRFLREQRSARAAEILNIHPSTLKYRLRRIEALTGRDLHDPDARFNLALACRIRSTLEAHHLPVTELQEELPLRVAGDVWPDAPAPASADATPPVEVAILDLHGVLTSVNDAWEEFCGHNGGDSSRTGVGTSYLAACAAAAGDPWADLAASLVHLALEGGLPVPARLTVPCHTPEMSRWFEMTVASRHDDQGRCCGAKVTLTPTAVH